MLLFVLLHVDPGLPGIERRLYSIFKRGNLIYQSTFGCNGHGGTVDLATQKPGLVRSILPIIGLEA